MTEYQEAGCFRGLMQQYTLNSSLELIQSATEVQANMAFHFSRVSK